MLEIGSIVDGKYKILQKIGQGGMSVVYLAINEKANMTWAIKEVRKDGTKDFEVVKQGLIVETDMLKKLKHPNLPRIVDVIDDEGSFLIVMDYIEGNPLSLLVEEEGAQPQELVVKWGIQLCDVLGYLHSQSPPIIYRDMKPANVMLKSNNRVTLIDFGTAREFKGRNVADTVCLGTIGYAAPEQFGGHETDPRTDIYCLGATLYHLVTGKNPSEPPYEIEKIRDINPSLSSGLEEIILKCTQKNPNERYQNCDELRYDLQHYKDREKEYRKKEKRKLAGFITVLALSFISLATGITGNWLKKNEEQKNYDKLIEQAKIEDEIDEKIEIYKQALDIQPDGEEAFEGLIEAYKDDNEFSANEANDFKGVWEECKNSLEKNKESYRDICFEVGKMYWYYYSYAVTDENTDNSTVRMKSAKNWFEDVVANSDESYNNFNMSKVYAGIGDFYTNIQTAQEEAEDVGMYSEYWDNLSELVGMTSDLDQEIVRLEMYRLVVNSIENYAVKFANDDVNEEDLSNVLENVKESAMSITVDNSSEKLKNLLESVQERIPFAERAVKTAYSNRKEQE